MRIKKKVLSLIHFLNMAVFQIKNLVEDKFLNIFHGKYIQSQKINHVIYNNYNNLKSCKL